MIVALQWLKGSRFRVAAAAALFAGLLVLVIGGFAALSRPTSWTAESTVVVLPAASLAADQRADYFETLSRGQVVSTFAEVAGNRQFEQEAENSLGFTEAERDDSTLSISMVPATSVVLVHATSTSPRLAEQLANTASAAASDYFTTLAQPFSTQVVDDADGTAFRSGATPPTLFGVVAALALGVAVVVRQAVLAWTSPADGAARGGRRSTRPSPQKLPHPVNGRREEAALR